MRAWLLAALLLAGGCLRAGLEAPPPSDRGQPHEAGHVDPKRPEAAVADLPPELGLWCGGAPCVDSDPCTVESCQGGKCLHSSYEAGPCLDQSMTGSTNLGANINEGVRAVAQTFTAGRSGTLAGVAVQIDAAKSYPLHLALRASGQSGPGAILDEVTLTTAGSALSQVILFPKSVPIAKGTRYAISADYPSAPPPGAGQAVAMWGGQSGDPYPAGGSWSSVAGATGTWASDPSGDLFFRVYVRP